MPTTMGISPGLKARDFMRKFRWVFSIPTQENIGNDLNSINTVIPKRFGRPSVSFKEMEFQHLSESIWYPMKPEWKTLNLVMFDACKTNPVFRWIKQMYDPTSDNTWTPIATANIKKDGKLQMLNGCGQIMETWTLENCYPQTADWGELDMDSSEIVTVDVILRYDRAYPS